MANQHEEKYMYTLLSTTDPKTGLPALTTLLYNVCDNSAEKFDEACRLIELFLEQGLKSQ